MLTPQILLGCFALAFTTGAAGVAGAWLLRRRSTLRLQNFYGPAALGVLLLAGALAVRWWAAAMVMMVLAAPWAAGAVAGRRWRMVDLGAGEELRNHELARRWIWQPAPARALGERRYLRSQGELVNQRPWPPEIPYISVTAQREHGPRLALGAGQHLMLFGATGAGKTTTARCVIAARTLVQHSALFVLDQKGDDEDVEHMRRLAAAAQVPFILFDPQDPATDRWQPLWGTPDAVAARAVEPIKQSEPYYYDMLRKHLDVVCEVLHAADRWPPSVPFLVDACHPQRFGAISALALGLGDGHAMVGRRVKQHSRYVNSPKGTEDLSGGAFRLEVALALASRRMVTPRITSDHDAVGVRLVQALRERAVVMWRTHADTMPDEAAALSVLALADLHDAAEHAHAPWTLLLDEFGAVIEMAARRAVAILQRGRSHGGQVIVITQSAADIEALTQQPGLLASLTDNFAGVVAHRQTAPESRDWLAKLMGTRSLWQTTNQTTGHGSQHSGSGSARRVREFKIGADVFSTLRRGEAVIYTPIAGEPRSAVIQPTPLADHHAERIHPDGPKHACEASVHPELTLPTTEPARTTDRTAPENRQPPDPRNPNKF
jgi:TraM recognition site of TraD and TraG/Type IV secretion-system coupling protein DNA-binding domain